MRLHIFTDEHRKFGFAEKLIKHLKKQNKRIVLTSGSYDLLHIGHAKYIAKARSLGDVLIIGLDSDEKVRKRKGKDRPIVLEKERADLLSHLRAVDYIIIKDVDDGKMSLMEMLEPDILVISESTKHTPEKIEEMERYCGELVTLEPQAQTSTTARIRKLFTDGVDKFAHNLSEEFEELLQSALKRFKGGSVK